MTRNNADFEFFHVSRRQNREGIEREGLKANAVTNGLDERDEDFYAKGPGVWVSEEPEKDYGDDVYGIKNPSTGKTRRGYMNREMPVGKHDPDEDNEGHIFIPHDVPISDFKRVGHIYQNPSGHTEVHWHKEEDCNG